VRDALSAVVARTGQRDAVLVKGSRAVGLEVVADALVSGAADPPDLVDRSEHRPPDAGSPAVC
jgi:hypothetical protein